MGYGHNKTTKKQKSWDVKESKRRTDPAPQSRVDLKPQDFDQLLKQKGIKCKVYRSMYCPNVKSVDGAEHNLNCTMCNGSGFIDVDPICTLVLFKTQELNKLPEVEGMVDGNTVVMTFPIGIELQYFTRIDLEDFTDIYFQRILRKEGSNVDILKYAACRVNVLIDANNARYYQDQDFTIDTNGNIMWGAGNTPADNTPYTIHYEAKQQYRATAASHVNRFTQYVSGGQAEFIKMPEEWYCTKEFFPKRKDGDGNDTPQGPYDNHTIVDED